MPPLTVLMPIFNGERFIKDAIESTLNQSFGDYELLIIDDKSRDNSKNIVLSYKDKRIRFIQNEENLGQMETLNKGVKLSRGQYIARMDQDDTSLPDRFKKEIEILDKSDDIGLVYSDSFIIDEEGKRRDKTLFDYSKPQRLFVFNKLLRRNFIAGNTVMLRKKAFEKMGLYNSLYKIAAEYDLYLRLAQQYKVDFIDEPLAEYRAHGENTSAHTEKCTNEVLEILKGLAPHVSNKRYRAILNNMLSWHTSSLAIEYLTRYDRRMCKDKAYDALRINPLNSKAIAAFFLATFAPYAFIDRLSKKRKGWLD